MSAYRSLEDKLLKRMLFPTKSLEYNRMVIQTYLNLFGGIVTDHMHQKPLIVLILSFLSHKGP